MRCLQYTWVVAGALLVSPVSATTMSPFANPQPWSEVESLQAQVKQAGQLPFEGEYQKMFVAPDGRIAVLASRGEQGGLPGPQQAILGTYTSDGNWLVIRYTGMAVDLDTLDAAQRTQYEDAMADIALQRELAELEAAAGAGTDSEVNADAAADADVAAQPAPSVGAAELPQMRVLVVPVGAGELLVRAEDIRRAVSRWDGLQPLSLSADFWRNVAADAQRGEYGEFTIANPLTATLPPELRRLLRRDPVETTLEQVVDKAESLTWRDQSTVIRLRLDRGEMQGLYQDMDLFGLPPDENLRARIVESHDDYAIATMDISRFSPDEEPALPTPGAQFSTRLPPSMSCHLDTSIPVGGKLLSVSFPVEGPSYDDEGYAFFTVTIDQGSAQGLSVGDEISYEDYGMRGEGRVRSVTSHTATILWRIKRYYAEQELELPAVGDEVGTSSWRRDRWESRQNQDNLESALQSL